MTVLDRASDGYRHVKWEAGAKSTPVNIEGCSVLSLFIPSTFTCTAMTFEVLEADGTYVPVHYKGALLEIDVTPGARNILPVEVFASAGGKLKVVLDTNETGEGRLYLVR